MIYDRKNVRRVLGVLFAIYVLLMLWLLFIRNRHGFLEFDGAYWQRVLSEINLKPFHTIGNFWHVLTNRDYYMEKWEAASIYRYHARHAFINLAGNVVMFVPLGFFLPALCTKLRKFLRSIFSAAGIVVTVELTQLFTLAGHCDVDDLILNMAGAAVGYGIFRLFSKIP